MSCEIKALSRLYELGELCYYLVAEDGLTAHDRFESGHYTVEVLLEDIALGAHIQSLYDIFVIGERRQIQNSRLGMLLQYFFAGLQAAHSFHADVHQHDIRILLLN